MATQEYTTNNIMEYLMKRNTEVDKNFQQIKDTIEGNVTEVKELRKQLEEQKLENVANIKKMDTRMNRVEEALKRENYKKMKSNEMKQMEEEPVQAEDKSKESPEEDYEKQLSADERGGAGGERTKEIYKKNKKKSDWAVSIANQLRDAAKAAEDLIAKEKAKEKFKEKAEDKRKVERWFGEDSPVNLDNSDSSESDTNDDDDEDFEDIVTRKEKNRLRRKKSKENRRARKEATAAKAQLIIGVGPIEKEEIEEQKKVCKDYGTAKEQAVRDFFRNFLQFEEEELERMMIEDTQVAKDNFVYMAFSDIEMIWEIHWRVAAVQDPKVQVRNFVPPNFWDRYMFLSRACTAYRAEFPTMKTQMRFSNKDVEIILKERKV